ncbi:hypothetical protein CRE_21667 [Caenorhabditis remanei]|uniref:Uncharacterized protein n=1 Tax=Caenorhabditis remanei TaxID=31234 RepID=E3NRG5_CAERE|nr:hypothetical protein CRE_21667 [Caenorhabditis remanei]
MTLLIGISHLLAKSSTVLYFSKISSLPFSFKFPVNYFKLFQNNEKMDTISDRHHRCLFGWVHVSTTIRLILAYFVLFNVGLGLLGLPWFSIYIGLSGLCLCFFTCFHVYKKNDRMMFPFYLYVWNYQQPALHLVMNRNPTFFDLQMHKFPFLSP